MWLINVKSRPSLWFGAFALISLFLCFVTVFAKVLPSFFSTFNLRNESNFAALFSGIFLLVIALHSFDGWALNRSSRAKVAKAWVMLSLVLIALSFDEVGSLHERMPSVGELSQWWSLLPFGFILGGMAGYTIATLWRAPGQRTTAVLICIGFALLASVALQEYIEHRLDWSANRYLRFFKSWLRPVVEEGTELLGMLVLLKATMNNTRGILSNGERSEFPVLAGIVTLRRVILVLGMICAPLVAYVTVILPPDRYGHGIPADWPAAALYSLAAFAAARPYFVSGRGVGWLGWALVAISIVGCASTVLPPDSTKLLILTEALCGAALVLWLLDSRYVPITYVPAGIILSICLAGIWFLGHNDLIVYTAVQYVALAFYWVNSSASQMKSMTNS